ncbi:MAG: hypothetical protein IJF40_05610 [Clostridia bacterium]|nr:hypothetical protein [Clostridia bacterium]
MNEAKLSLDVEFSDEYLEAKKDVYTALKSISKLTPWQKEKLFQELMIEGMFYSAESLK